MYKNFMHPTQFPQEIKDLYKHWHFHTYHVIDKNVEAKKFVNQNLIDEIKAFIKERMNIWRNKNTNIQPLTTDPILSKYRFCNVFRELDRQTIEFHTLLNPIRDDFPLWLLNMFYCRVVARVETVKYAGLLSFNEKNNENVYERLMNSPRPRFGTPYVFPISTIQKSSTPTRELFLTQYLPTVMRDVAKEIINWRSKTVYEGVGKILPIFKYNLHFHWTEVLIDVAYQYPYIIDLFGEFPIGPGALPTLSRIEPKTAPSLLVVELSKLKIDLGLLYNGRPLRLSAENWEGIACEFRKYTNLKSGHGRRRLYK